MIKILSGNLLGNCHPHSLKSCEINIIEMNIKTKPLQTRKFYTIEKAILGFDSQTLSLIRFVFLVLSYVQLIVSLLCILKCRCSLLA